MPAHSPYLFQRNERSFYVRIAIPEKLRLIFRQREIKKTLPTDNMQVARLQASYVTGQVLALFKRSTYVQLSFDSNSDNLIDIQALNFHCKNELTQLFAKLHRFAPEPEIVIQAAETGFGNQFKPSTRLRISEFTEKVCQLNLKSGRWTKNYCKETTAIINTLIEMIDDKYLDEVGFKEAELFFDITSKTPKNRNKNPIYCDLSIGQIIRLAPEPMSATNINKYMNRVSQLFKQAEEREYITKNPFSSDLLRIKNKTDKKDQRQAFRHNDLQTIFGGDLYTNPTPKTQPYAWALLLLLYTGARLNEVCQLHVKDIKQIDGIWVIEHTNCCDKKHFKTNTTKGAIVQQTPIHQELIDLGFLSFVEQTKRKGVIDSDGYLRLFPFFTHTAKARYGKKCSEFFNGKNGNDGYKHRIQLQSVTGQSKLDLHSFRHTMATALQQADVPDRLGYAITGHTDKHADSGERYRKGYTLQQLQTAINKVSFKSALTKINLHI